MGIEIWVITCDGMMRPYRRGDFPAMYDGHQDKDPRIKG